MGLTAALALLAAFTAGNDFAPHSKADVLAVVWGTTIGLALAHWFALLVAALLVSDPLRRFGPRELLVSQTTMALVVAISATLLVLPLPSRFDRLGARIAAALFIGALAAVETRRVAMSTSRRVVLSVGLSLAGLIVATAKWFIS